MRSERVLVVGATGMLGAPVARRLLADGWRVRCLVRDGTRAHGLLGDDFDYVVGDVTRVETLNEGFEGCDYVHHNLRGVRTAESYQAQEVEGVANCAQAARKHGARRVTYLSGAGRNDAALERYLPVRVKRAAEAALGNSGVSWTAFRATHFMESLALFVRNGRATVLGRQPHRLHYLAAEDYAAMVSRALDSTAAAGRALYLWGPDSWTMTEALQQYVAVLHPTLKVQTLPIPIAQLIAVVTGNQDLRFATELFTAFAAIGEDGAPGEANRLLGAPPTRLSAWLEARRNREGPP